jgi:hypothetical protein
MTTCLAEIGGLPGSEGWSRLADHHFRVAKPNLNAPWGPTNRPYFPRPDQCCSRPMQRLFILHLP